jgi:membrane-associated HD superfamily phosphohydrolase
MLINKSVLMSFPVIIIVFIAVIVLQNYCSKKQNKYLGMIIPLISFIVSILLSVSNFNNTFNISFSMGAFIASVICLVIYNVTTLIFLGIYIYNRRKKVLK